MVGPSTHWLAFSESEGMCSHSPRSVCDLSTNTVLVRAPRSLVAPPSFLVVPVVIAVITLDDGSVDAGLIIVDEYFRLCESIEVSGLRVINPLFAVDRRCSGSPVYYVLSCHGIVGSFRSPGTSRANLRGYFPPFSGQTSESGRWTPRPSGTDFRYSVPRSPSVSAVDLQICGDEIELISFRRTDNEWIPDALLSQRGGKHRLIVVQVVPVQSVLAGGRNRSCSPSRISLACKVSKEIVGVVRIRNFRRSRLNGDWGFLLFQSHPPWSQKRS